MGYKTINWFKNNEFRDKTVILLFGGDFCPIRRYEQKILAGKPIFDDYLKHIFKGKNLSIINFEAPICSQELKSIYPEGNGLRVSPEVCTVLKAMDVDLVGLGNNHLRDFGNEGVIETFNNLAACGIDFSGAGKNSDEAQKMFVKNVNGLTIGIWVIAEKEFNLADEHRPGTAFFSPDANVRQIPALKKQVDFLVIFPHAGHEFMLTPSPRIRKSYRDFIDAGADLVVGHHPHVVQGIEQYGEGFIAYSLGNLVFDSPYVSDQKYTDLGFLLQVEVGKSKIHKIDLIPYYLRDDIFVSSCDESEPEAFRKLMNRISDNLKNELKFRTQWHDNVKFRFNNSYYKDEMIRFSAMFMNPENTNALLRLRNKFACPTHQEFMETLLLLMENGDFKPDLQQPE